jgi:hypothetical protein
VHFQRLHPGCGRGVCGQAAPCADGVTKIRYACHDPRPPLRRAKCAPGGHALSILYLRPRVSLGAFEPARAEAGPCERERLRRVSFQRPMCTGAMPSAVRPPVPGGRPGCPGRAPPDARRAHHPTPAVRPPQRQVTPPGPAGSGRSNRSSAGAGQGPSPRTRAWGARTHGAGGAKEHRAPATRGRTPRVMREDPGSVHRLFPPQGRCRQRWGLKQGQRPTARGPCPTRARESVER